MRNLFVTAFIVCAASILWGTMPLPSCPTPEWTWQIKNGKAIIKLKSTSQPIRGAITIPAIINGYPVGSIGNEAFAECDGLTSVIIPEGVTSIGERAFSKCTELNEVKLPISLTTIENGAFFGCAKLSSLSIPISVSSIGDSVFFGCSKLWIYVEEQNATYVSWGGALFDKEMKHLVSYPRANGFYKIPATVIKIGSGAFSGCQHLKSIKLPSGVTSIGNGAFYGCTGLTTVTIPSRVNQIGSYAFHNCVNLENVNFLGKPPKTVGSSAFPQTEGTFMSYHNSKWSEAFDADGSWNNLTLSARERDKP